MKTLIKILCLSFILSGLTWFSSTVELDDIKSVSGLYYHSNELYTGNITKTYKSKTLVSGYIKEGKKTGLWNYYSLSGKKLGYEDYDKRKYEKHPNYVDYVPTSIDFKEIMQGVWKNDDIKIEFENRKFSI